ncbi:hypothetical protein [Pseudoalteromonas viridis]|uniref:Uncharacterized protein n=1 Tax=Pseudoalteromonas viridis TaxID=339617 RepID=A0ABX7V7A3_9GAMM|nr:hypothetical protein [Pseudoalteromonas viridis]QTL36788.1 hypothetical protein J5X90_07135 [Pseudoalteromonas viridis]
MKKFIFISALFLLLSSTTSLAAGGSPYADHYNNRVERVYINETGQIRIKVTGIGHFIILGQAGEPKADARFSMAMAAKLAQENVWVRYTMATNEILILSIQDPQ